MTFSPWPIAIAGAIAMAYAMAGLFFLRFWVKSRDRLFIIFAVAFWLLMAERLVLLGTHQTHEWAPYIYLVRMAAFLLILGAIIDKNRKA
jgi:hypothetical protein